MGRHFLKLVLEQGYTVKALVRSPDRLDVKHPNLTIVKGDVLNREEVDKVVQGTDMVVSLFGHSFGKKQAVKSPDTLQTEGTLHIVHAMKKNGVSRIISLSGGAVSFPEKDRPKLFPDRFIKFIMHTFFSKLIRDGEGHAEVLRNSGLNWMLVRGARFTDEDRQGKYRIGWVGVNSGSKIGRIDLARFILTQL